MPLQLRLKGISCLPWKSLEVIVSGLKAAFIAAALCIMAASPAFAAPPPDRGPTPGLGWGPGGKGISVPGPVAGVGIPVLIAAGGYLWLVRRNRARSRKDQG